MVAVREIRYVGYGIPYPEIEGRFYREVWGLTQSAVRDGMTYFAAVGHDEPYVVRLRQAEHKRVDVIALAADDQATVDALHEKVSQARCRVIFTPRSLNAPGGGYGFRFFSPDGLPFEVSSDVERGPKRELQRWEAIPQKISHVVLHSPNHQQAVVFFTEVLGFRVSDWLGDFMCFLRCNSSHHRIAVLPGPACVNHVAFDVLSVDDMMRGIGRLKESGVDIKWGPGRHTAGNNTFSYFTTPSGFAVEYTAELEEVDDATHQSTVHVPSPRVMDQWGVGVGGPGAMPHAQPDSGLFQAPEA